MSIEPGHTGSTGGALTDFLFLRQSGPGSCVVLSLRYTIPSLSLCPSRGVNKQVDRVAAAAWPTSRPPSWRPSRRTTTMSWSTLETPGENGLNNCHLVLTMGVFSSILSLYSLFLYLSLPRGFLPLVYLSIHLFLYSKAILN